MASVLLSVGVVAVLGASRAATRLEDLGRWSAGGADRAAEALAALEVDPCATGPGAGALAGTPAVSWTLVASGSLRTVDFVVPYPTAAGRRPATFAAAFLCLEP